MIITWDYPCISERQWKTDNNLLLWLAEYCPSPKDAHILFPRNCEYINIRLDGKEELSLQM